MLTPLRTKKIIARAADDVVAWDQLGCLSPHVLYVQSGGAVSPVQFAEQLAARAGAARRRRTARAIDHRTGAIASRQTSMKCARHSSDTTQLWQSPESTAWTVVCERMRAFKSPVCIRFIYVKPVRDLGK